MSKMISLLHIKYLIIIIILLIYLFFLKIKFFPYYLVVLLLLLGVYSLCTEISKLRVKRKYIIYFTLTSLMFLWSVFSIAANYTYDYYYPKEVIFLGVIYFISAFAVKSIFKIIKFDYNIKTISFFLIITTVIQLLLSFAINSSSVFLSLVYAVFEFDSIIGFEMAKDFSESRFIGFGTSFFGLGVFYSYILIIFAYYIKKYVRPKYYNISLLVYFLMFIAALLFSRTSIVGFVLSLFILFSFKNLIKAFLSLFFLFLLSPLILLDNIFDNDKIAFGLDFIFNFKDSQAASSLDALIGMYSKLPDNMLTWILGDAKYREPTNVGFSGYYKHIDVGYLRVLFYSGIIGLFLFILVNSYIIFNSFKDKFLAMMLFLCFLILNIKGVAQFYSIGFLYFLVDYKDRK